MFKPKPSEEPQLPGELAALEKQLSEFTPMAVRVDRDRLMFAAGRAAATAGGSPSVARPQPPELRSYFWPAAAATMSAATVLLAVILAQQAQRPDVAAKPQAVVDVGDAAVEPPSIDDATDFEPFVSNRWLGPWVASPTDGYLGLRYVALTRGVEAIISPPTAANGEPDEPTRPATASELLEELLPTAGRARS